MAKKNLKKFRFKVKMKNGLVLTSKEGITPWSEFIENWKTAAGKSLPDGSGSKTVLEWIEKMGTIGRKKGRASRGDEDNFDAIAPIPQYLELADAIGAEKNLSEKQLSAVAKLKKYLEDNDNENSNINPQNIYFNTVSDFEENEDGKGIATDWKKMYGDYRTPQYRDFRNEYKEGNVPVIPEDWYSENAREANPPVYQALWGTNGTEWFGEKSLLEICTEYEEQLDDVPFESDRENPFQVAGNGTADFLMQNVPGFRAFVLETVKDTANYRLPNGNYRAKRAMTRQRKNPVGYPLNDAQAAAFMEHINASRPVDTDNLFLDVNWRQMEHAAKSLPEYKSLNYGVSDSELEKKSKVSEDGVKKSQEKSLVSLSWKEIMKVRT